MARLRSCKYCGHIHSTDFDCGKKPQYKKNTDIDKFRWSTAWKHKREEIRQRDLNLCQICIRNLHDTVNQYTYDNLSVHHAISLDKDYGKRLDNNNLICLCQYHHERAESGDIPYSLIQTIIDEQEEHIN